MFVNITAFSPAIRGDDASVYQYINPSTALPGPLDSVSVSPCTYGEKIIVSLS